jgi:DNA repair ATPase RecN
MPKSKSSSRPARWAKAISDAKEALAGIREHLSALQEAKGALEDLKSEYEEWQGNLPENAQNGPTAEKLQAVVDLDLDDLDLEDALDSADTVAEEAENLELPQGFGRD